MHIFHDWYPYKIRNGGASGGAYVKGTAITEIYWRCKKCGKLGEPTMKLGTFTLEEITGEAFE